MKFGEWPALESQTVKLWLLKTYMSGSEFYDRKLCSDTDLHFKLSVFHKKETWDSTAKGNRQREKGFLLHHRLPSADSAGRGGLLLRWFPPRHYRCSCYHLHSPYRPAREQNAQISLARFTISNKPQLRYFSITVICNRCVSLTCLWMAARVAFQGFTY